MPDLFYYPRINAPRSVIYQALLYWDRLVTVAPPGPLEDLLDLRMRRVNEAGLYHRLLADSWPVIGRVEYLLQLLAHLVDRIPPRQLSPQGGPDSYVHTAKLSSEFRQELERLGLSLPGSRASEIHVSPAVQLCLISIAAWDIIGEDEALYAHTDSPAAHLFAHTPPPEGYPWWGHEHRIRGPLTTPCLEVDVGGLLPVPGHEVLIGDLIAFRERYDDERRRLMMAIDLLVHGLQRHPDHPRGVLNAVRRELEDAVADLEKAGRAARMTWIRRSVMVSIALGAAYAAQTLVPEAGWVLGVIGGMAINVATNEIRPARSSRWDSPMPGNFSYLHRVRSALD